MQTIADIFAAKGFQSERQINRIRVIVLLLSMAMSLSFFLTSPKATLAGFVAEQTMLVAGLVACGLLVRGLSAAAPPRWLHAAALALDLFLVTASLLLHSALAQTNSAGISSVQFDAYFLFYFVINATCAMRFSERVARLAMVSTSVLAVAAHGLDAALRRVPFDPISCAISLLAIAGSGFISLLVIRKSRELIAEGIAQEQEKEQIKSAFSRYVSSEVADEVLKGGISPTVGVRRDVTILFADIRGFTRMSEAMPPEEVVALLNTYFSAMVDAIFSHGGTIDKYMGDGLMAVFGAPVPHADHAIRAVRAAEAMRQALQGINERRLEVGQPPLRIGIGLHTGECVIGNIGAEQRVEYTAIGDAVNTASRIEGLTKELGADILMSASTYASVASQVETAVMAPVSVKGKTAPLQVHQLIRTRDALPLSP